MKRRLGESKAHYSHRLFMERTRQMLANHKARAAKFKKHVEYDLETLRGKVRGSLGFNCRYCGDKLTVRNFSGDHQIPLGRDGRCAMVNVQIICLRCNQAKGSLTAQEFACLYVTIESLSPDSAAEVKRALRSWGKRYAQFARQKAMREKRDATLTTET